MKALYRMMITASLLLAFASPAAALDVEAGTESVFLPDYARAQFAGDFGLLSVGPGFSFFDRHLSFDATYGFTPLTGSGVIHQFNAEIAGDPLHLNLTKALEFHPIRIGLFGTAFAGSDFWRTAPERFPDGYNGAQTRFSWGPSVGSSFFLATTNRGILDAMDVYWRLSVNSLNLKVREENSGAIGASDILSLGFGMRMYF